MTRKHFIRIAATLYAAKEQAKTLQARTAIREVAICLAGEFAALNPHFDKGRFLDACGL